MSGLSLRCFHAHRPPPIPVTNITSPTTVTTIPGVLALLKESLHHSSQPQQLRFSSCHKSWFIIYACQSALFHKPSETSSREANFANKVSYLFVPRRLPMFPPVAISSTPVAANSAPPTTSKMLDTLRIKMMSFPCSMLNQTFLKSHQRNRNGFHASMEASREKGCHIPYSSRAWIQWILLRIKTSSEKEMTACFSCPSAKKNHKK